MAPSYAISNYIPSILLNSTIRFVFLRIVCVASLVEFINFAWYGAFKYLYTYCGLFIFVHHFATSFGPNMSLPGGLDLALIILEVALFMPGFHIITRFSSKFTVFSVALAWAATVGLFILAVLRIIYALKTGWSFLWQRYDITTPEYRHAWSKEPTDDGGQRKTLKTQYVLFGTANWISHFPGETRWLIISRGICAVILIVLVSLFALFLVVLDPVRETGITPVKESRAPALPPDFDLSSGLVYNVVIGRPVLVSPGLAKISPAISVDLLQLDNNKSGCSRQVDEIFLPANETGKLALHVITFECHPIPDDQTQDDILVTVNFSMLNIPSDLYAKTRDNSVQIFLGATNNTSDVVLSTPPTLLIPGVNLFASAQDQFRKRFDHPVVSAFGLFDSYNTFITSEIIHVWPEPRVSSLITRAPDVGTLRIVIPSNFGEMKIIQQSRDKSVLSGFASIGGLWTFLGGIFTTLFGTSILRIIFGTKPISVFGFTRVILGEKLKDACHTEYPEMKSDLKVQPDDKGLVAFLSDHLVDFDFLKDDGGRSNETMDSVERKDENSNSSIRPVVGDRNAQLPTPVVGRANGV